MGAAAAAATATVSEAVSDSYMATDSHSKASSQIPSCSSSPPSRCLVHTIFSILAYKSQIHFKHIKKNNSHAQRILLSLSEDLDKFVPLIDHEHPACLSADRHTCWPCEGPLVRP